MTEVFELDCLDCGFETTVDGEFTDAIAAVEDHRTAIGAAPDDHFVNIHRQR